MTDRNSIIQSAIEQGEKDKASIEAQLFLLRSALKPQAIRKPSVRKTQPEATEEPAAEAAPKKLNGTKPKGAPSKEPTPLECQKVFEVFGKESLTLSDVETSSGFSAAKVRACLNALVDNGDVIQMGNRRSLKFIARGVEFQG